MGDKEHFVTSKEEREQAILAAEGILFDEEIKEQDKPHAVVIPRQTIEVFSDTLDGFLRPKQNIARSKGVVEKGAQAIVHEESQYMLLSQRLRQLSASNASLVRFSLTDREFDILAEAMHSTISVDKRQSSVSHKREELHAYGFVDFLYAYEEAGGSGKDEWFDTFQDLIERRVWVDSNEYYGGDA